VEFPVGKVLHETNYRVVALRVSPSGKRIAFIARKAFTDHSVEVLDLAGTTKTVTRGWRWAGQALAWSPDEKEVWFSATEGGWVNPIHASNLSGKHRIVLNLPTWLNVQDISTDGRALVTMSSIRGRMFGLAPGETQERDLSWHEGSQVVDLTPDGKTVLFMEPGEGSRAGNTAYVRGTDGSPAKRIGVGIPIAISPDGRWAAMIETERRSHLLLLPTGVGEPRVLDGGDKEYLNGVWFPDGKRLLVEARVPGRPSGTFVQDAAGGRLQPIGPEGASCSTVSPDGREVICGEARYPIDGGGPKPIPGLQPGDEPYQWCEDRRFIFVLRNERIQMKVFRQNLETGQRELWREFVPPDRAGLVNMGPVITPNGRAYACSYFYNSSDLYLVTGLR
jgi:Tol biopolymer transport system component